MDTRKMKKTAQKVAKEAAKRTGEAIDAIEKAARPRIKAIKKAAAPKIKQLKKKARRVARETLLASAKSLKKTAKSL